MFRVILILTCFLLTSCDQPEKQTIQAQTFPQKQIQGTIIALGDSLTAGLGVAESDAWPALLETRLNENGYNWMLINAGISGETSTGVLSRIKWILAQKPDIVILETGANDGLRGIPINVIRDNISKSVEILQESNVKVVLAGMQIVQNLGPEYTSAFAKIYRDISKEKNCILIPFFLKGVAGDPSLNQEDTIHPNESGHRIIAKTVYPFIIDAISTLP